MEDIDSPTDFHGGIFKQRSLVFRFLGTHRCLGVFSNHSGLVTILPQSPNMGWALGFRWIETWLLFFFIPNLSGLDDLDSRQLEEESWHPHGNSYYKSFKEMFWISGSQHKFQQDLTLGTRFATSYLTWSRCVLVTYFDVRCAQRLMLSSPGRCEPFPPVQTGAAGEDARFGGEGRREWSLPKRFWFMLSVVLRWPRKCQIEKCQIRFSIAAQKCSSFLELIAATVLAGCCFVSAGSAWCPHCPLESQECA